MENSKGLAVDSLIELQNQKFQNVYGNNSLKDSKIIIFHLGSLSEGKIISWNLNKGRVLIE